MNYGIKAIETKLGNREHVQLLLNLAYGEIYRRLPPCRGLRAAWVKTWLRDARKFETN